MNSILKSKIAKLHYIGFVAGASMLSARPAYAAPTDTCAVGNASWLTVLSSLIADPVKWAMYVTAATTIVFIIMFGLKIRGAQGRQDKVERAMDFGKYFVGGSLLIFGATWLGDWFLGKFGCSL